MNTNLTSRLTGIFVVTLSTMVMHNAQATAALDNATLTKAANLLEEKTKIRKKRHKIKPSVRNVKAKVRTKKKKKAIYKQRIRTCDSYSKKVLHKKAAQYKDDIHELAQRYKVSPHLVMAVITVESCFRESVKSPKGAAGLMQLIPATASRFGTNNQDRYKPRDNIRAGTRYLQFLLKRFDGDLKLVAAAYNAGEGAVSRHKGIPPYKETRAYVRKVMNAYRKLAKGMPKQPRIMSKKSTPKKNATDNTSSAWSLKLAHHKDLKNPINMGMGSLGSLAFTTSEWKQSTHIFTPKQGISEQRFKQLL